MLEANRTVTLAKSVNCANQCLRSRQGKMAENLVETHFRFPVIELLSFVGVILVTVTAV